jgi:hypothetical protein
MQPKIHFTKHSLCIKSGIQVGIVQGDSEISLEKKTGNWR